MTYRLSSRARRDLALALTYSLKTFGRDAADRYQALILCALDDVADLPQRHGSRDVPGRQGLLAYAIVHSRHRVSADKRVSRPVHQIVYRIGADGIVDILAIIGDSYPASRVPVIASPQRRV